MPSLSEARTRKDLIDPALQRAGWDVDNPDQVGVEIPVDGFDPDAWKVPQARLRHIHETNQIYDAQLPKGVSDYALYRPNFIPIAFSRSVNYTKCAVKWHKCINSI